MNNRNCDLIIKQHKMIQANIDKILGELTRLKKDPATVDSGEFEKDLKQLVPLMEAHSLCEEQILLPILKEMYESQPDILQYVVEDHVVFQNELSDLLNTPAPIEEKLSEIKSLLNRVTVHFVEEENGLLPLVEMYLQSKQILTEK